MLARTTFGKAAGERGVHEHVFRGDSDGPAGGHGITGIDAEIKHDLLELRGIGEHRTAVRRAGKAKLDRIGQGLAQEDFEVGEQRAHLHDRALALGAASKGQQLADQ